MVRDPNLLVYNSREVAEHYAALNYLSTCERTLFEAYLRPGTDILDLGVGGGRTTPYLSSIARRYVGVDYAPEMVAICRAKYPELEFHTSDAADLSEFAESSFDAVVFAFNGIDYIPSDENRGKCLQECRRVLRSGGSLIFSTHNPRSILIRPLWEQQRVRSFAEKLAGGHSVLLGPLTIVATCAKAVTTTIRAIAQSTIRIVRRVPRSLFWHGEGWLWESSHGGLTLHYATPAHVIAEVEQHGFQLLRVLGDDYPRPSHRYITDWYYYVFAKTDETEKSRSCA
jgi:ubiquinone/menaquinone biosynthesis C-methylase UbiE